MFGERVRELCEDREQLCKEGRVGAEWLEDADGGFLS